MILLVDKDFGWLKGFVILEFQVNWPEDKDFGYGWRGSPDSDFRLTELKTKILVLVKWNYQIEISG
jgi:hypothetical protein